MGTGLTLSGIVSHLMTLETLNSGQVSPLSNLTLSLNLLVGTGCILTGGSLGTLLCSLGGTAVSDTVVTCLMAWGLRGGGVA